MQNQWLGPLSPLASRDRYRVSILATPPRLFVYYSTLLPSSTTPVPTHDDGKDTLLIVCTLPALTGTLPTHSVYSACTDQHSTLSFVNFLFIPYGQIFFLSACMCTQCVPGAWGSEMMALQVLEVGLGVFMSHSIRARDQAQVLLRATILLRHLSRPQIYFKDGTCSTVSKAELMLT